MDKAHTAASITSRPAMFEALEPRAMLSVSLDGGTLFVQGTAEDDEIHIAPGPGRPGTLQVSVNDETDVFRASRVKRIVVHSLAGDDVVALSNRINKPARLLGGRGDDSLTGGRGRDVIFGEEGDDDLNGGRGRDRLFSGEGQDVFQSSDSLREMRDRDEEDGVRIHLHEAPSAVRAAVLELLDGEEFENLLRETDEGATVFELEWEVDEVPHSAKIDLAGNVIELEVEIDPATLPAAVTDAIFARYPEGEITEAETLQLPGEPLRFEVEVENAGLVRELVITPEGDILADDVEGEVED